MTTSRRWHAFPRSMAAAIIASLLCAATGTAQTSVAEHDEGSLYILPLFLRYIDASDAVFAQNVALLRSRFAAGGPVKVGFTVYLPISMERWDVSTEADATANLTSTIALLDAVIARARAHNIPIALAFITPIRAATDAAQATSQQEDRRVMQWYSDNTLADGWWTYSRYARRQVFVRELYLRTLARVIANRMITYPETIVGAAGDGEIELAFKTNGPPYADYSPFAIAEFRDWLRGEGLYAPGQRYAGQAYRDAVRYRGDATPGADTNGDGHTLNGDFGVSFSSWTLRYFDWQLSNQVVGDPNAIPESVYSAPDWNPFPDAGATLFDAPRNEATVPQAWYRAWFEFRVSLVARYNQDFARIITTSPDPATGRTVPTARWFSYQIPADYLYGHTPEAPDFRYLTSASATSTADIRPFGGAGVTAFNTRVGENQFARTLSSVAPLVGSLGSRWAIFEWNPSVPATTDPFIYRQDAALVEFWRAFIVAPYAWDDPGNPVLDTGFEVAIVELIARMRAAPLNLRATATGNQVRLAWSPPESGANPDSYIIEAGTVRGSSNLASIDTGSRSTILTAGAGPGTYYIRVKARRGATISSASNEAVLVIPAPTVLADAPVALSSVSRGGAIVLNWIPAATGPRPTGYVLEARSAPGLANLARFRLGPSTTFFMNSVPAGTYHLRVRAETAAGESGPSPDTIITPGAAGTAPCPPVDIPQAPSFTLNARNLGFEWLPANGPPPTGYSFEASLAPGAAPIAVLPLTGTQFGVAAPSGTFYIRLRAVGACNTSLRGPEVKVVVP